jgi:hypothetical protein
LLAFGVVLALTCLHNAYRPSAQLLTAQRMRASQPDSRDASLRAQLARGDKSVIVQPAPLLWLPSNAWDFPYSNAPAQNYMRQGYMDYFRFPAGTKLMYGTQQPANYCVNWAIDSYYKAKSCAQLRAEGGN